MNDIESITGEADKIAESGILGRSRTYGRLLAYLVRCSADGRRPKEIEIAVDVFDKGSDFNPNQDSLVRVYVHNLRQKLDKYYAKHPDTDGMRLAIPKGEYRLAFVPVSPAVQVGGVSKMPPLWLSVVAGLLILNLAAVLKGPLIGLDENQLFQVCHGRRGSVWGSLRRLGRNDQHELVLLLMNQF